MENGSAERETNHTTKNVQSVDRAILMLESLCQNGPLRLVEVASQLQIHKSTAHRLLATLEAHGLVERNGETGMYSLGFGLVLLANAVTAELDIVQRSRPVCQQLNSETRETVTITFLEGDVPQILHQESAASSVLSGNWVGRKSPVHLTAAGKVLLAYLPKQRQRRIIRHELGLADDSLTTVLARLTQQLADIRINGYGYAIEEVEVGLNAVSAPIFAGGQVVAALSISGPSARIPSESIPEWGERVKEAAQQISRRMGHHVQSDVQE